MSIYDWHSRATALGALTPTGADLDYRDALLGRLNAIGSEYDERYTTAVDAQIAVDEAAYAATLATWQAGVASLMNETDRAARYAESLQGVGAPTSPITWLDTPTTTSGILNRAQAALGYPNAANVRPLIDYHLKRANSALATRPAISYSVELGKLVHVNGNPRRYERTLAELQAAIEALGDEADAFVGYMTSPIP